MIEIVKIVLDTLSQVVIQWINGSAEERAELEKRTLEAVSVMKNERVQTHEELAAADAETRRILEEEKKRQEEVTKP